MTNTCAFDALVHLMGNGMDEKEISSERPENNMFFDSIKSYMTEGSTKNLQKMRTNCLEKIFQTTTNEYNVRHISSHCTIQSLTEKFLADTSFAVTTHSGKCSEKKALFSTIRNLNIDELNDTCQCGKKKVTSNKFMFVDILWSINDQFVQSHTIELKDVKKWFQIRMSFIN